jgi:hypothetical protein
MLVKEMKNPAKALACSGFETIGENKKLKENK